MEALHRPTRQTVASPYFELTVSCNSSVTVPQAQIFKKFNFVSIQLVLKIVLFFYDAITVEILLQLLLLSVFCNLFKIVQVSVFNYFLFSVFFSKVSLIFLRDKFRTTSLSFTTALNLP